jgi:DNA-binding transcriptional LysR family regulator
MCEDAMVPNLDIDQLKTFLAIADTGSFTRAADEVNKTQSAVSMQMKRLEDTVGLPLFIRDGRGVRLSREGERLVEQARRLSALNDDIMAAFTKPELSGTVRLGTPDDYADLFLPEVMGRFARSHPRVNVDVECLTSTRLMEYLADGQLDVSLVTFCGKAPEGQVIRREELVWVTSQRHAAHSLDVVPLATADANCAWRKIATSALDSVNRKYRIAYTSSNRLAIDAAVLQGLAVAAMAEICVRPGMRKLKESEGFPSLGAIDIGLLYKAGKPAPATLALAQHIRESLGTHSALRAAAE